MSFARTVLITGGTSGLGFYCALDIARKHPEYLVVLASRTDPDAAATSINHTLQQKNATFLPLDLSKPTNVRSFVKDWEAKNFPPIQALLLNAGLQFPDGLVKTDDGMESTFAVNHFGHALLFHLLSPHLANQSRIVVTSSGTHDPAQKSGLPDAIYTTAEELAHPTTDSSKNPGRQRYSTSKLVNVLWTYALHKRFVRISDEKKVSVITFDPGLMPGTGLAREASAFLQWIWHHLLPRIIPLLRRMVNPNIHLPQESGASLARLAVSPELEGVSGVYYEGKKEIKSSEASYDEKKQEDLWEWTVKNAAIDEEEMRRFENLN